ncbi:hypothetical protein B0H16DRAFT_1460660 [Mycena metata]|uniref:Uncharacterized protein n=1 Tax=Mycena metata TaxID=1033252 RepID=A0AAD7IU81_9AGAR|nr:hypothetical protein B0H16DRAFT_1460660 [Mycena metata]
MAIKAAYSGCTNGDGAASLRRFDVQVHADTVVSEIDETARPRVRSDLEFWVESRSVAVILLCRCCPTNSRSPGSRALILLRNLVQSAASLLRVVVPAVFCLCGYAASNSGVYSRSDFAVFNSHSTFLSRGFSFERSVYPFLAPGCTRGIRNSERLSLGALLSSWLASTIRSSTARPIVSTVECLRALAAFGGNVVVSYLWLLCGGGSTPNLIARSRGARSARAAPSPAAATIPNDALNGNLSSLPPPNQCR